MPSMPSKRSNPKAYLFHIRENITLARSFIDGLEYESFRDNQLVFCGVMRALEIISEASRRLPDALKERHPAIQWKNMAAAGNIYRHDYEDVAAREIWDTLTLHLPPLRAVVETELVALDAE